MKNQPEKSKQRMSPKNRAARSQMIPGREVTSPAEKRGALRLHGVAWYANAGPVWKFALKFGVLMVLFYAIILTPYFDRLLYSYLSTNAWAANGILNFFGQDCHVSEISIRSARYAITVRRGCDAIEPSWFLCAALISFPAPFRKKLLGILVGAALLQGLNLIRIVSLYFIGLYRPQYFGPAHLEIWPAVFIMMAITFWIGWIGWSGRRAQAATNATA